MRVTEGGGEISNFSKKLFLFGRSLAEAEERGDSRGKSQHPLRVHRESGSTRVVGLQEASLGNLVIFTEY